MSCINQFVFDINEILKFVPDNDVDWLLISRLA